MKLIPLTKGKHAIVDDEDFEYLNQWKWHFAKGYSVRRLTKDGGKQGRIYMHRVVNKTPDGLHTDHRNANKLDNRKNNLRDCTNSQNQMNREKMKGFSSIYKGVHWRERSNCWRATIKANKKHKTIGYFSSEIEAAKAYDNVALKLFGEFARPNFK